MKTVVRVLMVLFLLAAGLPVGAVTAADDADPQCAVVAQELGASYKTGFIEGSIYCILYPPTRRWNRDVVIFAHGYVDARKPLGNAWDQMIRGDVNLPGILLRLGYGFATTSYSKNGLAVKEGVDDVVALAGFVRSSNKKVRRIFLTGASEGGLVTALAAEQFPQTFSGAFSTCGPIGDFQGQVQYWGNFRVGYDTAFPVNPLVDPVGDYGPSTPIYIDPFVVANWESLAALIANELQTNPASGAAAVALLDALDIPYDPADLTTVGESLIGLLYYNVEATNDGRLTLVPGTTFDQLATSNAGSPYFLPPGTSPVYPLGFAPDPQALAEIAAFYQTSGSLSIPMVIMHTRGDPIVPAWHATAYLKKAFDQGSLLRYVTYLPVDRYGHCDFTPAEMVLGFYIMVLRATFQRFSEAQIQSALPDPGWQAEFKQLKAKHKEK
jgi:hypothetical protein